METGWSDFFVAEVGAAAALSGLVIVAISINLQRILENRHVLPGRAGETLATLVSAMLVASLGLIPHQSATLLGTEVLAIGLALLLTALTLQIRSLVMVRSQPIKWWLPRLTVTLVTALPLAIGGFLLALGKPDGMYWVAAAVMLALTAGVFNTWILLIEILR